MYYKMKSPQDKEHEGKLHFTIVVALSFPVCLVKINLNLRMPF
jgi:hypothetical protein